MVYFWIQDELATVNDLFDGFVFKFLGVPLSTHDDFLLCTNISRELSTIGGVVHYSFFSGHVLGAVFFIQIR